MAVKPDKTQRAGKLKIGDNWNAITIIALSQSNPLKAIAEFVENSIDARARNITIIRGKQRGETYLKVIDDGDGIDDFKYVATHIGASIKRELKMKGVTGIQGEFGIGLLSFWTVGEEAVITSMGAEGIPRRMKLVRNNPGYSITDVKTLFDHTGTELLIQPLLSGIRQLSGEKIQNYLASELRDRIGKNNVSIRIIDRTARKELTVEPRKFKGRLLHHLPDTRNPLGEIYVELYINDPSSENHIGLYKSGTRVISSLRQIDTFSQPPWNSLYLEGIIDASFLQLTPGTREGVVYDDAFDSFANSLSELETALHEIVEEQKKAEEDKTSKSILKKISKAIREALYYLPRNEYGWLDVKPLQKIDVVRTPGSVGTGGAAEEEGAEVSAVYVPREEPEGKGKQKEFFEYPGPLATVRITPSKLIIGTSKSKQLRAVCRDRKGLQIDEGVDLRWEITEGGGTLRPDNTEIVEFSSPKEPGVSIIKAAARQNNLNCTGDCIATVTETLLSEGEKQSSDTPKKGLPGYTFLNAAGELWRSRYDRTNYIIIINNGHADFVHASKSNINKLRYISKIFAKELVLANFPEATKEQLLERMVELQLYTEEHL